MVRLTAHGIDDTVDLSPGTPVEVRRRFDRAWARGFEVIDVGDDGYRLKRSSDDAVLPVPFPHVDVRAARHTRIP
jgi:hypothetical protein